MSETFTVACIQLNSSEDVKENLEAAGEWIRLASEAGAHLIVTPEHTPYFPDPKQPLFREAIRKHQKDVLTYFADLAVEKKIWLNIGMVLFEEMGSSLSNCSLLLNPRGQIIKTYHKIHLFVSNLSPNENHAESKIYKAGQQTTVAEIPWGNLGISICYDLRFPLQYRNMRKLQEADFFSIPAAFTAITGEAHWRPLLQARAIENGCFVFASNQCGTHPSGATTYGHSMIISPWGEILAEAGEIPGFILATIDRAKIKEAREKIPSSFMD